MILWNNIEPQPVTSLKFVHWDGRMAYVLLLSCLPNVEFLAWTHFSVLLLWMIWTSLWIPWALLQNPVIWYFWLCLLCFVCLFFGYIQSYDIFMTCVKSTLETSSEKSWDLSHNWWMFWFWSIRRGSCTGIYAKRMKKATKCKEHADTGMHHFIIKPSIDILTPQLHHLAEKWWVSRWLSPQRITRRCSRFSWCPDSPLPGLKCGVTCVSTWMTGWPSRTFEENTSRSLVFVP